MEGEVSLPLSYLIVLRRLVGCSLKNTPDFWGILLNAILLGILWTGCTIVGGEIDDFYLER